MARPATSNRRICRGRKRRDCWYKCPSGESGLLRKLVQPHSVPFSPHQPHSGLFSPTQPRSAPFGPSQPSERGSAPPRPPRPSDPPLKALRTSPTPARAAPSTPSPQTHAPSVPGDASPGTHGAVRDGAAGGAGRAPGRCRPPQPSQDPARGPGAHCACASRPRPSRPRWAHALGGAGKKEPVRARRGDTEPLGALRRRWRWRWRWGEALRGEALWGLPLCKPAGAGARGKVELAGRTAAPSRLFARRACCAVGGAPCCMLGVVVCAPRAASRCQDSLASCRPAGGAPRGALPGSKVSVAVLGR